MSDDDRGTQARLASLSQDVREIADATNRHTAALARVLESDEAMKRAVLAEIHALTAAVVALELRRNRKMDDPREGMGAVVWMLAVIAVAFVAACVALVVVAVRIMS